MKSKHETKKNEKINEKNEKQKRNERNERHILRESWETDYRYNRDRGTHASGHICTWNRRKHNALVPGPCRWVCAWETWNHFHTTRLQRCCSTCHWCKSCRQFQTKSQKGTFLSLKETLFCEAYAYLKIGAASFTHDLHSHIHINIFHWREPVFKIQRLKNQKKSIPKVKVKKQTRKFQKVNKKQFAQIRLSIIWFSVFLLLMFLLFSVVCVFWDFFLPFSSGWLFCVFLTFSSCLIFLFFPFVDLSVLFIYFLLFRAVVYGWLFWCVSTFLFYVFVIF